MEYTTIINNYNVKWTCDRFSEMPQSIKDMIAGYIREGKTSGTIGDLNWWV